MRVLWTAMLYDMVRVRSIKRGFLLRSACMAYAAVPFRLRARCVHDGCTAIRFTFGPVTSMQGAVEGRKAVQAVRAVQNVGGMWVSCKMACRFTPSASRPKRQGELCRIPLTKSPAARIGSN